MINEAPGKYYELRIERIFKHLGREKTSSLIISKDENIYYLTGFYGKDSKSMLLFTESDIYLLVSFIYFEQAKKSIGNKKINIVCCRNDKYEKLNEILGNYNIRSVGAEGNNINYSDFLKLDKLLSRQKKNLIEKSGTVEELRLIKDRYEISNIKSACKITDKVFKSVVRTGASTVRDLSEIELALKIEGLLVKNGSDGRSFEIVAAYDGNSSMPHYFPKDIKLKDCLVLMDFGCRFKNYCSDMTRTIFAGNYKKCAKFKEIYDIVLEAQRLALESCREGISSSQLDRKARKFIASKGYGENFGHGLGHGVGLEVHERPRITMESETVLRENMVITIEPGIYIENFGGIRIEDMVVVRKNKCEILYDSTKEFLILD